MPDLPLGEMSSKLHAIHRPQISVEQYLVQINQSRLRRWNVIVLLVESLRPDQLRAFGGERTVMPNIEQIAGSSCVYLNAYTQASHSDYADMCPLSSQYPLRSAKFHHYYPRQPLYPRVLIYDVLKAIGYRTAIISSQDERWGNMLNYLDTGSLDYILHAANYDGPTYVASEDTGFSRWAQRNKKSGKIDDAITVTEAIRWIEGDRERPFFLYINLQNSHIPYVTPDGFPRRFGPKTRDFPISFGYYAQDKIQAVKDLYGDSLAYVDAQIGRLFECLKRQCQWDRTVIVISGDTGQAFYEHGFAAHASQVYNEVMRVPLLIRAPDLAPRRDDRLVEHVDVPPTVLYLLGMPPHPGFQGHNVAGEEIESPAVAFMMAQTPLANQAAVVCQDFKLIYDCRSRRFHLYDLERDPLEQTDLAEELPAVTGKLARLLKTWSLAQLEYYSTPRLYHNFYPPVLETDTQPH